MSRELEDAYRAPEADDDVDDGSSREGAPDLYVISVPKLVVLHVATVGVYALYWFYKQFSAQRRYREPQSWPVARAFLSVFFVHRLFRFIDGQARDAGDDPSWNPNTFATLYVVVVIGARVVGRLAGSGAGTPSFMISTLIALAGGVASLTTAQRVANRASGDPTGKANAGVDAGSVLACIGGAAMWALLFKALQVTSALEGGLPPGYEP